jgi:cholesterol transport system auxiliary component
MTLQRRAFLATAVAPALAACSVAPTQAPLTVYDLGPGPMAAPGPAAAGLGLTLQMLAPPWLESTALLYRLGWRDATQLQSYRDSRWAAAPSALLAERLRQAAALRAAAPATALLRVELSEFAQHYSSPEQSQGVLRLRASLIDTAQGRVLRQRAFGAARDAATPDAAGGVHALAAAADDAVKQVLDWCAQPGR